jgi:hypothetical protein
MSADLTYWVARPAEAELRRSIEQAASIVLVYGARRMGKSSLVARALDYARMQDSATVLTDLGNLSSTEMETIEALYRALAGRIAGQLRLPIDENRDWDPRYPASLNFERFVRRRALAGCSGQLVWAIDNIDRLVDCSFASDVFGLFRAWHNERSYSSSGPWTRLTLVIAHATEPQLFINDPNQSPFNVGIRITLENLTVDEIADLNAKFGLPLQTRQEEVKFRELVAGQPYLAQRGLCEMAKRKMDFATFAAAAADDDGPYGDHLREFLCQTEQDPALAAEVRGLLRAKNTLGIDRFYELRSRGLVSGHSADRARILCEIYRSYLARHLL